MIVDAGGTDGKLETPISKADQWPRNGVHLDVPTRELDRGDELLANDQLLRVLGQSHSLPRFPPRPLIYTSLANAARILPSERHRSRNTVVQSGQRARANSWIHRSALDTIRVECVTSGCLLLR